MIFITESMLMAAIRGIKNEIFRADKEAAVGVSCR